MRHWPVVTGGTEAKKLELSPSLGALFLLAPGHESPRVALPLAVVVGPFATVSGE